MKYPTHIPLHSDVSLRKTGAPSIVQVTSKGLGELLKILIGLGHKSREFVSLCYCQLKGR